MRDVVVNHLLQVVAAAAMEAPSVKGTEQPQLQATQWSRCSVRVKAADPANYVRGQYDGYRDIDGVFRTPPLQTYAALRLEIDNWRWAGVAVATSGPANDCRGPNRAACHLQGAAASALGLSAGDDRPPVPR